MAGRNPCQFLRNSKEIKQVFESGRRFRFREFRLLFLFRADWVSKGNIVVGKRYGNAPARNRVKRRYRELLRTLAHRLAPGYHYIVVPNNHYHKIRFSILAQRLESAIIEKGIIKE